MTDICRKGYFLTFDIALKSVDVNRTLCNQANDNI